uniref:Nuclear receptor domain-containing protein n=1 Tax=Globodera pallida TaxID=36090 RepID=A0A183BK53_GLOPA
MGSPTSEASFDFVDTSRAESGGTFEVAESGGTFEVAESGGTFQVEEKGGDKSGTAANQQQTNPSAFLSLLPQQQSECCVVCSDNASGHHYGAFFKRSILSGQNYKCAKNNQCPVDPISRIRCQKCRCLARGMNPTLVKNRKKNDSEQNLGLEVERVNAGVVDAFKLRVCSSGYALRLALNDQFRTGTNSGNPTV